MGAARPLPNSPRANDKAPAEKVPAGECVTEEREKAERLAEEKRERNI